MFVTKLIILGAVGAIIGYVTNTIAVKMIFRPLNPIKIPLTNFEVQGLIPKRRKDIARTIGEVVDKELISMETIFSKFFENNGKDDLVSKVKNKLKQAVGSNLPPVIPSVIRNMISEYANEIIDREAEGLIMEAVADIMNDAAIHVKIAEIVEEKINGFELEKLEEITIQIAKKELQHIEILGGVIGFFIGIVQGVIILNI